MSGFIEDLEIKTKNGWKTFNEIDIKKDELYCRRFEAIDDDCLDLCYEYNYLQDGNPVKDTSIFYINPLKKIFHSKDSSNLIQIKNEYIDLIATDNYELPIIFSNGENRYENWSDLESLSSVWEWVNSLNEYNKKSDFENDIYCFSETPMNKNQKNVSFVKLYDISVKLQQSDFSNVSNINKSIVSFEMPKTLDDNVTWGIYVRRNGKEFWI